MRISLLEPIGVPEEVIDTLSVGLVKKGHKFIYYDKKTDDVKELIDRSKGSEVVMIANNPYPKEVVDSLPDLRMLSMAFTGIDHVAAAECKAKEIMVCNTSGYSDETVAELVIGMAIGALRKVNGADDTVRRQGSSAGIGGGEICNRTVGIIELGKIGLRAAQLFRAFGARVIACGRTERPEAVESGIEYRTLDEVLSQSDIISLHMPLNTETCGFINEERISLMKKEAVFINCARGPIVDNEALARALNEDRLAYACIDVFDNVHAYIDGKPQNVCRL